MSDQVTIVDVAKEAGVSYATVSRVINNEEYVKPATRQRVQEALARLGYVGNRQARSLRGGRSHTIGVLAREISTSYVGEIIRGIGNELVKRRYDLMLYTTFWHEHSESSYVARLTQGMVDGLLLILPRSPEKYQEQLQALGFPYVLIDHQGIGDESLTVSATNHEGSYEATHYLIGLGHQRIGFITGDMSLRCSVDRLHGYRKAMQAADLSTKDEWIVQGDFAQPSGYSGATQLLQLECPPTAIFASNDLMAFGVMEAVRECGLRIPQDISVIGFDDIPQASNVHPPLTTVSQSLAEMGGVATRLLFDAFENNTLANRQVLLSTQLIVRDSCQEIHT